MRLRGQRNGITRVQVALQAVLDEAGRPETGRLRLSTDTKT